VSGLEAFTPAFLPGVIAAALEAATLPILVGFVLLVRWYFVAQEVVVGRRRGIEALRGSWELTRGQGWQTFARLIVVTFALSLPVGILVQQLDRIAKSANSSAMSLGFTVLNDVLIAMPLGLAVALLYFDLRARRGGTDR
jgi:uncharacterized membrane protein